MTIAHYLIAVGLTFKPSKISFGPKAVTYLSHVTSAGRILVRTKRVEAIYSLPVLMFIEELRSFLGVANLVRRYIKNHAEVIVPLTELTRRSLLRKTISQKVGPITIDRF